MTDTIPILTEIFETSQRGSIALGELSERLPEQSELRESLESQRAEYNRILCDSSKLLRERGESAKGLSSVSKAAVHLMAGAQLMWDDSPQSIAGQMIDHGQQIIIKMQKHINDDLFDDKDVRRLGERLIRAEEKNAKEMRKHL